LPNEISQIILAHIDEVDDSNEAQVKESYDLYDEEKDYLLGHKSNLTESSKNYLEPLFNRIDDKNINQDEDWNNFDKLSNKKENFTLIDDDTFQEFNSSNIQDTNDIENTFNISSMTINSNISVNTQNFSGSDEFENVEIIESTTLTETFISTTTSETTSIIYPGKYIKLKIEIACYSIFFEILDNPQFIACMESCNTDHECVRTQCLLDSTYIG
jgi:hypothetical protein